MPNKEYKYKRATFYFEGKQYEATGKTMREAIAKAERKKIALENEALLSGSNMITKQWAKEWLETYKAPSVGEGQYKNYLTYINGVIIPAIGNKKLKDVSNFDLQDILNKRSGKSKSDISKLRNIIKAIFKQARISRLIVYDPSEHLILPSAEDGTHRSITKEERKAILLMAETHYAGLWIKTMLYCGLRPGETRALNWGHVDFNKRLIHVKAAMKATTKKIGKPKSDSGIRDVPIPDKLYSDLKRVQGKLDEPVFMQPTTGRRHTKSSMQCLWGNFKRELDISLGAKLYRNRIIESKIAPDLVPYCLRHTYGTDLQDADVPLNVAKYLMGHADIAMTANIYTHTSEKAIISAARKINISLSDEKDDRKT